MTAPDATAKPTGEEWQIRHEQLIREIRQLQRNVLSVPDFGLTQEKPERDQRGKVEVAKAEGTMLGTWRSQAKELDELREQLQATLEEGSTADQAAPGFSTQSTQSTCATGTSSAASEGPRQGSERALQSGPGPLTPAGSVRGRPGGPVPGPGLRWVRGGSPCQGLPPEQGMQRRDDFRHAQPGSQRPRGFGGSIVSQVAPAPRKQVGAPFDQPRMSVMARIYHKPDGRPEPLEVPSKPCLDRSPFASPSMRSFRAVQPAASSPTALPSSPVTWHRPVMGSSSFAPARSCSPPRALSPPPRALSPSQARPGYQGTSWAPPPVPMPPQPSQMLPQARSREAMSPKFQRNGHAATFGASPRSPGARKPSKISL
ncbi:unnamed protein product [Effrenium voratum]|uniref:Uncharacterized protein n=2 Tax=Effrenium voratum TaxID=2562239 RepID=A0AA36HSQ3_9DINO|nr:unnamed protein product [Effrenium voratum]CAJ1450550.1 unnamed protein product [Effrenium voratum]